MTLRSSRMAVVLTLVLACARTAVAQQAVEYHPVPGNRGLPFSEAVRVGDMLYVSGQLGTDASLKVVPGGIQAETRQALENIRVILERHGSSLDRVVKCTAMLADMKEWAAMNTEYRKFFGRDLPARSAFGCNGLAMNARVEIECIAVKQS